MNKMTSRNGECRGYSSPELRISMISIDNGFAASSIDFNGSIDDYANKDVDPSSINF